MKLSRFALALVLALSAGVALAQSSQSDVKHTMKRGAWSAKQMELSSSMRKLWEDHVTWTRLFIVSAAAGLPDKAATTQRLLQNQTDIGNAIKPLYGSDAGNKLTALLKDHIVIAAEVVTAAKMNDKSKLDSANKRWFANADDISMFLSGANPTNWKYNDLRKHMHHHLKLTTDEAVAQLKGDWSGSIRAYDKVHEQILGLADMLTEGIIAQFPDRFR